MNVSKILQHKQKQATKGLFFIRHAPGRAEYQWW